VSGRKALVANVWVDGVLYGPAGKKPDKDVAEQITNPKAWADTADADSGAESGDGSGIPPKGGAGSGKDAWKAYADSLGVAVDDDATRDDIVAALEAAGHPTE
jgi:hypothetical protein